MKKFYSLLAAVALTATMSAQNVATWDSPNNGSDWVNPLAVTENNANITVTPLTRGAGLGAAGTPAGYSYGGSGADQSTQAAAITDGDFFTTTVKANSGYKMSLTGIPNWFIRRSGSSGTCSIVAQYSTNGSTFTDIGTVNVTSSSSGGAASPLVFSNAVQTALSDLGSTTTVTFRFVVISSTTRNIYFLTGTSSANEDRFSISGTVSSDPTMAVGDAAKTKANLVKSTIVSNELIFGAAAKVSVYNTAGQVVKTAEVTENSRLDVSALPKGTYIVAGSVNGQAVSQKIIKK